MTRQVCKSVCKLASKCLAHRVTTNLFFRNHELIEGEPKLEKDCPLYWDINEDTDTYETVKCK